MWESLPPVASSSTTPADELTGVHVVTHTSGMLSGGRTAPPPPPPPAAPPVSNSTPRSRGIAKAMNASSTATTTSHHVCRSPSAQPTPFMPAIVTTVPNSNPFASPRDISLNSLGASMDRDLSARSNVAGAPQQAMSADGVDSRQASAGARPDMGGVGSSKDFFATPHASTAALPTPSHARTQSLTSASYTTASPLPPPHSSASFSASFTSARQLASRTGFSPSTSTAAAPSFSPRTYASANGQDNVAAPVITRTISPRHPHATYDTMAGPPATSPSNASAAPWQSPGSISVGSARLTNENAAAYFSPALSAYLGDGGSAERSRGTNWHTARTPASTSRVAPMTGPDQRHPNSPITLGASLSSAAATATTQLDLAALQVDPHFTSSDTTPSYPRLPQTDTTPVHRGVGERRATMAATSTADGASEMSNSSPMAASSRARPPPSAFAPPATAGDASNNTSTATVASGTSLTFISPHYQAAGAALDASFMSSPVSAGMPAGLNAVRRPQNASPLGAAPLMLPNPEILQQSHSGVPTASTTANNRTGLPAGSASSVRHSGSGLGRPPVERTTSDVVRMVGTEATSPGTAPARSAFAASAASAATAASREREFDVRRRPAPPPDGHSGRTSPSSARTPYHSAAPAGQAPAYAAFSPHAALGRPFTPPQGGAGGGHHVSLASLPITPPPAYASFALPQHLTELNGQQAAGGNAGAAHPQPVHGRGSVPGTFEALHAPTGTVGSMDHNQSFYQGTTGNDNLLRSFFFPPNTHTPPGEKDEAVTEGKAADGDASGPSFDLASYLRSSGVAPQTGSAEQQSASPPQVSAAPIHSTNTTPVEVAEGDRYRSPVLYRVSAFPASSPSQPDLTRVQPPPLPPPPPQRPSPPFAGTPARASASSTAALAAATAMGLDPAFQPSMKDGAAAGLPPYYSSPLSPSLRSSLPEEPLRITTGVRPRLAAPHGSVSASSPYTRAGSMADGAPLSGSTRATTAAESARTVTAATNANASFLSPTLANSMMRHRFEDSMVSATEASFALPESSVHMTSRGAARQLSGPPAPTAVSAPSAAAPPVSASLPRARQKPAATATSAGTPVAAGPAPPYILEWERSLIAFQNRAESYYTFKDLCTETYLTLIEHDVDRFLVCYYSGGAVRPEEAVQEALASRAGTPAAATSNVLSSISNSGNGGGAQRGGGLQKMLQTSKTLQKISETGSKWLTNLKRTAMTPVPVWGEPRTPSSSLGTATPVRGRRSCASSVSSTAVDHLVATQQPPQLPSLSSGKALRDEAEEWWMSVQDVANNGNSEPIYSMTEPSGTKSDRLMHHLSTTGANTETLSTDVAPLVDRPLSSSGKSFTTTSTLPDVLSSTSSFPTVGVVIAGTPRKRPLSRLSYNIAAEEELQCLRQLGCYMANVIPETYMDARPSEQVLRHVRVNYPIILHALQHVLMMGTGVSPPTEQLTRTPRHPAGEAARMLIANRLRQGLLLPSIQATWRDYLLPLEMKVKELVQIAAANIDPILVELEAPPVGSTQAGEGSAAARADVEARQRLRALRDYPVRRFSRLLRGDEEYLTAIHIMDDEFIENGEAWQARSAAMRRVGAALSDYVPVYGLVLSRLHRLEMEHRTVLELWCGGA